MTTTIHPWKTRTELTMPLRSLINPRILSHRYAHSQRRTFLGLRRTPPPSTGMSAYLVAQGLGIVLLIDLGIATVTQEKTTLRAICQAAGWWKDPPGFEKVHGNAAEGQE